MSGHPTNGPQAPAVQRVDLQGGPFCGRVVILPWYHPAIGGISDGLIAQYKRTNILTNILTNAGMRYVFVGYVHPSAKKRTP